MPKRTVSSPVATKIFGFGLRENVDFHFCSALQVGQFRHHHWHKEIGHEVPRLSAINRDARSST